MLKAYIGGPMTGRPAYNYAEFQRVAAEWRARGYEAHTPFESNSIAWERHFGRPFNPFEDRCDYGDPILRELFVEDVKLLLDCDVMVLLDGWEDSRGTTREEPIARMFDMPVYDERGVELK